jgi:O-antigen ligase/Flp pilus assembly protein TadD
MIKLMKTLQVIQKVVLFVLLTAVPITLCWGVHDPNIVKEFLFKACVSLLFLLYAIKVVKTRQVTISLSYLSYATVAFLILSVFSYLYSDYAVIGSVRLELLCYFVLLFFLMTQQATDVRMARHGLEALSLGAFLVSGYGIFQFFGIELYPIQRHFTRISATLGHPNFLGGYLVAVLPVTTGLSLSSDKPIKKYLFTLFLVTQAACLLLTLSRASWISACVSFICFGVICLSYWKQGLRFHLGRRNLFLAALVVFTLIAVLASINHRLPESERSRLTALTEPSPENTFWARWLMWMGTLQIISDKPIVGNGLGAFSILFPANQPAEFSSLALRGNAVLLHSHNEYLEIWAETGMLGLIAFVCIMVGAIGSGVRLIRFHKDTSSRFLITGILSGIIGISLNISFSVNFRYLMVPIVFWFYLGVINGLTQGCGGNVKVINFFGIKMHGMMALLALLFLLLYFSLHKTVSHLIAERHFYTGLTYHNAGKLPEALQEIQTAFQRCKSEPKIYYKKGALETRLGKWAEALATYKALNDIHPDFFHLNFNLSLCYLTLGDLENAIRHGKRQIELYPEGGEQYYVLGKACYFNKNHGEAETYFDEYVKRNPNSVKALGYLGNIFAFRSEWERAIVQYERALAMSPDDLNMRLNVCQSYLNTGDFDKLCLQLAAIFQGGPETSFVRQHHKTIESIIRKLEAKCDKSHLTRICPAIRDYLNSSDQ